MKTLVKIALLTLVASTAAQADEPRNLIKVQFADLNLDSPIGAQRLMGRLKNAAREVCEPANDKGLTAYTHFTACKDQALASAIAAVNKPTLNALYRQTHSSPHG